MFAPLAVASLLYSAKNCQQHVEVFMNSSIAGSVHRSFAVSFPLCETWTPLALLYAHFSIIIKTRQASWSCPRRPAHCLCSQMSIVTPNWTTSHTSATLIPWKVVSMLAINQMKYCPQIVTVDAPKVTTTPWIRPFYFRNLSNTILLCSVDMLEWRCQNLNTWRTASGKRVLRYLATAAVLSLWSMNMINFGG